MSIRAGYQDSVLDNRDGYAKIKGTLTMTTTAERVERRDRWCRADDFDWIQGRSCRRDPGAPPVKFGAAATDILDLSPANFDGCAEGFHNQVKVAGSDPPAMTTVPTQAATVTGKTDHCRQGEQRHGRRENALRFDQLSGDVSAPGLQERDVQELHDPERDQCTVRWLHVPRRDVRGHDHDITNSSGTDDRPTRTTA